ncbi:MAG: molybdopterin synthase sulfur carrier subunit [Planctomycetota bacterium]|jgi:molybdopterin synthase sulfur carrier subunit
MIVHIPSPLLSYTDQETPVEAQGNSLIEVLHDLDGRYAGFMNRVIDEQGGIREHIRFFLNTDLEEDLEASLGGVHEVHIICALSGG